jgi:hypothetical protein
MEMLRHSTVGHIARFLTRDRILSYPNEQEKFEHALQSGYSGPLTGPAGMMDARSGTEGDVESANSTGAEKTKPEPLQNTKTPEGVLLIGWYSPDDTENPQNWSNRKRYSVGLLIW